MMLKYFWEVEFTLWMAKCPLSLEVNVHGMDTYGTSAAYKFNQSVEYQFWSIQIVDKVTEVLPDRVSIFLWYCYS